MPLREQGILAATYINAAARIRTSLLTALVALFTGEQSWRDADRDTFLQRAVPLSSAAQAQTGAVTAAYLARMIANITGRELDQQPVVSLPAQLRGVDPAQVYGRPYAQIWRELQQGATLDDAVDHGRQRLESIAATDLELAATHAARDVFTGPAGDDVVGFRRVLTGIKSCALCMIAATQRYHGGELLPIHPACDCAIAPIIGDDDPGQIINAAVLATGATPDKVTSAGVGVFREDQLIDLGDVLDDVHDTIQKTFGTHSRSGRDTIDYRSVLVVHEHGEIGPVLAKSDHHFTGPSDLPSDIPAVPAVRDEPDRRRGRAQPTSADNPETGTAVPDAARPFHRDLSGIEGLAADVARVDDGATRTPLTGGASATTELVQLADGTRVVTKVGMDWGDPDEVAAEIRRQADAEQLTSLVGRAIGAPVVHVYRQDADRVWINWIEGQVIGAVAGDRTALIGGRDGQLLGLLDHLAANGDRNSGNIMVSGEGDLVGIDHGFAYGSHNLGEHDPVIADGPTNPSSHYSRDGQWVPNPLTVADVDHLRERLTGLRPDFALLGHADWLDHSLSVLDQLAAHASGEVNLLG